MNLWAKRAGLLLSAAVLIFLISCEDDSYLLGFKGKTKFKGAYQELSFSGTNSSVLRLDSIVTDNYDISSSDFRTYRFLIGEYEDPALGLVRGETYAQFLPNAFTYFNRDKKTLVYDSTTIQLFIDPNYVYGPSSRADFDETITVYDLDDSLSSVTSSVRKRYFSNSTIPYKPTPIGVLNFKKSYLEFQLSERLNFFLQARLDDEFGFRIFSYAGSKGDSALVGDNLQGFRDRFYGLAFVPTSTTNRIMAYQVTLLSKVSIHYHVFQDTVAASTDFFFYPYPAINANAFDQLTTARVGDLQGIDAVPANQPFYPASNDRYIQDGSVVITELNLSEFYNFIDTLEDVIINSAEISLPVQSPPPGINPPPTLFTVLMKETPDNKIVPYDMRVAADSIKISQAAGNIFTDLRNFGVSTELSSLTPLMLSYNSDSKAYVGYATLFFQNLFKNKDKPELRIDHLGLYPVTAPTKNRITATRSVDALLGGMGNSVNRAILKGSDLKLKIYYTTPNMTNLE